VPENGRRPTRLEIIAARAQVALDRRTKQETAPWLARLAATRLAEAEPAAPVTPGPRNPARPAAVLPHTSRRSRALASLPARPMQGRDVLDLQRQLVAMGYGDDDLINGVFLDSTETAVRRFQTDFDILNDGVCGRVTQRVLSYLEEQGIDKDNAATVQQRHMISFIVKAQQGGFVVIDLVSRSSVFTSEGDEHATSLADSFIDQLGRLLEVQIDTATGMQSWMLNRTDIATQDEGQVASFANRIKAEFMITLSLADVVDTGPGCATFYFGMAPDVYSHVGRPLAESIQREIVRIAGAPDRGTHAEFSHLFEQAQLPTIRVEFANLADDRDLARLRSADYLNAVAAGIASGVKHFYMLGQNGTDTPPLTLGATARA
jgi:N-acetylmuramoyl-L-alanine amidase